MKSETILFRAAGVGEEDADTMADGTQAAFMKLSKYFDLSSSLALAATVLDPRMKMEYYENDSFKLEKIESIIQEISKRFGLDLIPIADPVTTDIEKFSHLPIFLRNKTRLPLSKRTLEKFHQYLKRIDSRQC